MQRAEVLVVAKRTAYGRFLEEGENPRVQGLLDRADASVRRWKSAHDDHVHTLDQVLEALQAQRVTTRVLTEPQRPFDPTDARLVVTVGGDGTLLAASHSLGNTPVLGVNSSPKHSIGSFCAARASNASSLMGRALDGMLPGVVLARMRVELDGKPLSSRVLNEGLFCHAIPAATSRYLLRFGRTREEQRSSGLWIGTAAGSTGALRSAGGKVLPLTTRALQCVVREPYQGERRPYRLQRLVAAEGRCVEVVSKMQDACLFLDGPFQRVPVTLGQTLRFSVSEEPLDVLGLDPRRRAVPGS